MAGKHIYIEAILDNLLGGFQTTFDKMITAINRMTGHTDDDEGKSLVNVVEGLNEMTEKLDDQIDELQNLVAASSIAITKLLVTNGTDKTQTIGKATGFSIGTTTVAGTEVEVLHCQFLSHASGSLRLNCELEWSQSVPSVSYAFGFCRFIIFDSDNNIIYTSPEDQTNVPDVRRTISDAAVFFVEAEKKYTIKVMGKTNYATTSKPGYVTAELRVLNTQFDVVNLTNKGALDFM